jgi:hypothetical protein
MGVSETGLRLAMLDTLRTEDEAALQRAVERMNESMIAYLIAQRELDAEQKKVRAIRTRIAETTHQMSRLVERNQPCTTF